MSGLSANMVTLATALAVILCTTAHARATHFRFARMRTEEGEYLSEPSSLVDSSNAYLQDSYPAFISTPKQRNDENLHSLGAVLKSLIQREYANGRLFNGYDNFRFAQERPEEDDLKSLVKTSTSLGERDLAGDVRGDGYYGNARATIGQREFDAARRGDRYHDNARAPVTWFAKSLKKRGWGELPPRLMSHRWWRKQKPVAPFGSKIRRRPRLRKPKLVWM